MPVKKTASPGATAAFRGEIVDFTGDPATLGDAALRHQADGLLLVRDGKIVATGPAATMLPTLALQVPVTDYRGKLIVPGFVDTHIHYAQTDIIAFHGAQLLAETLAEKLFALIMLGDDRAVYATYILGRPAWMRARH